AQTSSQCIKETFNRYLPLPSSATRPANSVSPKPQIIARNRARPRRSHKPSRSNLHSAPQPPASLTAVSFPGGFRTPAPVQAASSRWAVIRNPSQEATSHMFFQCLRKNFLCKPLHVEGDGFSLANRSPL